MWHFTSFTPLRDQDTAHTVAYKYNWSILIQPQQNIDTGLLIPQFCLSVVIPLLTKIKDQLTPTRLFLLPWSQAAVFTRQKLGTRAFFVLSFFFRSPGYPPNAD